MKISKLLTVLFLFATPLLGQIDSSQENNVKIEQWSKGTKKNKSKEPKKDQNLPPSAPSEKLTLLEMLNKISDISLEKYRKAREIEKNMVKTFLNEKDVITSFKTASELCNEASRTIKENLKITPYFNNKESLEQEINNLAFHYDVMASSYSTQASEWPKTLKKIKDDVYIQIELLKIEGNDFEKQNAEYACYESYKQIATLLTTLHENGEPDNGELAKCQKKLADLAASSDLLHLSYQPCASSRENFQAEESCIRKSFYHAEKIENTSLPGIFPLDGQSTSLHLQQFYRYLIQKDQFPSKLRIKVFENNNEIHEEVIDIPSEGSSWESCLISHDLLLIPESSLKSLYGFHLQLHFFQDPNYCFSLIISQKGTDPRFDFSLFLDDLPLYNLHFIPRLPWQLEALRKPKSTSTNIPLTPSTTIPLSEEENPSDTNSIEEIRYPLLDLYP